MRNIEFQLDSDGVIIKTPDGVHLMDENKDRDLIREMKEKIMNDYPEAYELLINWYKKAVNNRSYFNYLIVRRFIACNFMRADKTKLDIDEDGEWNTEEPLCPIAGECEGYKTVCFCKMTSILTNREMQILSEYVKGKDMETIAEEMYISVKTVNNTIANSYKKINAKNRTEAAAYIKKRK